VALNFECNVLVKFEEKQALTLLRRSTLPMYGDRHPRIRFYVGAESSDVPLFRLLWNGSLCLLKTSRTRGIKRLDKVAHAKSSVKILR
jgi:hypothetical protein